MTTNYKLQSMAKDFKMKTDDFKKTVGDDSIAEKKATSVLTDAEVDRYLNILLTKTAVDNLDAYFNLPAKKEEKPAPKMPKDAQFTKLEGMARELFGTRVKLDGDQNNGKITLYYYNAEDLQRIWDVLQMANGED